MAIKKGLFPFLPNLKIESFEEPVSALSHFEYCLKNNIKIDLIISDLKHPKPDGFEFSRTIRESEKIYNQRIPILIISMHIHNPLYPIIIEFLADKTFDKVLPKSCSITEVVEVIKELIF
ncbi:MAG: response regulator [Ferruginibacter sp.]|nr:response regulator [Ferruginibacter sp.]